MQELIDNLISKVGLTPDQADKTIETIKDYIIQKFPMLEGAVNNMFESKVNEKDDSEKAGEVFFDNIKLV